MITPYKDRVLDPNGKVAVYRCLNKVGYVYSVRQFGKVIGHTSNINLIDVEFKVSAGGKKRTIDTGLRNVHATINGLIADSVDGTIVGKLKYYPFCDSNFTCNGNDLTECDIVVIDNNILSVLKE